MHTPITGTIEGNILYEPSLFGKPGQQSFEFDYWLARGLANAIRGGRGQVLFIRDGARNWVLRHYRRGGLIAKLSKDRYWWWSAAATRSFREWRLLANLRQHQLPVPVPVAARYVRSGLSYRADLITQEIPGARSLAECLSAASLTTTQWQTAGAVLARFHALGVQHADLNAHNMVFDADDAMYVLDFDRGRMRAPDKNWINKVLSRLQRSLNKLHTQRGIHFNQSDWQTLMSAHDVELARLQK